MLPVRRREREKQSVRNENESEKEKERKRRRLALFRLLHPDVDSHAARRCVDGRLRERARSPFETNERRARLAEATVLTSGRTTYLR